MRVEWENFSALIFVFNESIDRKLLEENPLVP
jgi:hypothetical protein